MPTVPSLDAANVQAEPLPGRPYPHIDTEVSPQDFGAGLASGIEAVGTAGADQQAKIKEQNDHLRVIDANTQLEAAKTQMLYGQDGQGGAFSLHGMQAMGLPDRVMPQYDQVASQISQALTPDQQRMFQAHISLGKNELNTQLNRYEYEEGNRLADQVFSNGIKQTIQNASVGWRDPDNLMKSRLDVRALTDLQGDREGWSTEQRQQTYLGTMSELHQGVVESMSAQGNISGARSYLFQAMGAGEMEPKAADGTLRMLNSQEEHKLAMDDKMQRDASNNLLKSAILKQQNGQLTPQWIEQHHATWEPQAYEYAYALLSGKKNETDPHVYAPLMLDAMSGKDVTGRAQDALYSGQITQTDFKGIIDKSEAPRKGYVQRGADYISQSLKPNPMVPDPAGQRSLANAMDDWRQWTEDNPQADENKARDAYRTITDHYQILQSDKTTLFNAVPLHLVGSRTQPDIPATWAATKAAHDAGELSDPEFQRQATLLMQWNAATQVKKPAKPANP
jgi:hypothetical protein